MNPLVSVIIPCYNGALFIEETIQSVLNQTYENVEIIVVNDGSTDNTAEIISRFASLGVVLINKKNSGVSDSRNIGFDVSKGDYIAFLDADDMWEPNNLSIKVNALKTHQNWVLIFSAVKEFIDEASNFKIVTASDINPIYNLIWFKPLIHCPASALIRRSSLQSAGGFDTSLSTSADWEMWLRLALTGSFGYIADPLVLYRVHDAQMHKNVGLFKKDMLYAFNKHRCNRIVFADKKTFRLALSQLYLIIGLSFIHEKMFFKGLKSLFYSICTQPKPFFFRLIGKSINSKYFNSFEILDNVISPFFSIVIPTWNRADMIGKTLESVFAQNFTNFEVIVVDDGSTDNTKEVVESFTDSRLQYIWQQNAERAAARNNGTRHAKGQYITFLDSDDLFKPEHLAVVYRNLEKHSFPSFYHQSFQIEDIKGKILYCYKNIFKKPLKRFIKMGNFFGSVGLFLSPSVANEFLFDETRILAGSEDYEMLLRLTLKHPILCGEEMTTRVINHENRGEIKINKDKLIARVEYLLAKTLSNDEFCNKYRNWLGAFKAANYSFIALHLAVNNYKKDSLRFILRAFKSSLNFPFSKRFLVVLYKLIIK